MTDDEKAAAVQEGLASVRMCPECGAAMDHVVMTHDWSGKGVGGWACLHPHPKSPVFMLDDGTPLEPSGVYRDSDLPLQPIGGSFTLLRTEDLEWDGQQWVPSNDQR